MYCGPACQRRDSKSHKKLCKTIAAQEFAAALAFAEDGNAQAQASIGTRFALGTGVTANMEEAVRWYRRAATAGYTNAQYNLGVCYLIGNGVAKDAELAVSWFRRAADAGFAAAQNRLGVCYVDGIGVSKDPGQALA